MPDSQVYTSGLGCSLRARSGKVQDVVADHAVRAGVCPAFPSWSREARHTALLPAPAPPPRCPARAGLAASVLTSPCQGSVVIRMPFPPARAPSPGGVHPHLAAGGGGRGRSSLCRPHSSRQALPARAAMEKWLWGRQLSVSSY